MLKQFTSASVLVLLISQIAFAGQSRLQVSSAIQNDGRARIALKQNGQLTELNTAADLDSQLTAIKNNIGRDLLKEIELTKLKIRIRNEQAEFRGKVIAPRLSLQFRLQSQTPGDILTELQTATTLPRSFLVERPRFVNLYLKSKRPLTVDYKLFGYSFRKSLSSRDFETVVGELSGHTGLTKQELFPASEIQIALQNQTGVRRAYVKSRHLRIPVTFRATSLSGILQEISGSLGVSTREILNRENLKIQSSVKRVGHSGTFESRIQIELFCIRQRYEIPETDLAAILQSLESHLNVLRENYLDSECHDVSFNNKQSITGLEGRIKSRGVNIEFLTQNTEHRELVTELISGTHFTRNQLIRRGTVEVWARQTQAGLTLYTRAFRVRKTALIPFHVPQDWSKNDLERLLSLIQTNSSFTRSEILWSQNLDVSIQTNTNNSRANFGTSVSELCLFDCFNKRISSQTTRIIDLYEHIGVQCGLNDNELNRLTRFNEKAVLTRFNLSKDPSSPVLEHLTIDITVRTGRRQRVQQPRRPDQDEFAEFQIEVVDSSGQVVRRLSQVSVITAIYKKEGRRRQHCYTPRRGWLHSSASVIFDGRNELNELLPDGVYTIRAIGELSSKALNFGQAPSIVLKSRVLQESITLDSTNPTITNITPEEGAVLADTKPAFQILYSDNLSGVDTSSVRISLDGLDVTPHSSISANEASFTPTQDLNPGLHSLKVELKDRAGNSATSTTRQVVIGQTLTAVSFSQSNQLVSENTPIATATVILAVGGGATTTQEVSVVLRAQNREAINGQDFQFNDRTVVFPVGSSNGASQTVSVAIFDDNVREEAEQLLLVLSNPLNGSLGNLTEQTIQITDDDPIPIVNFANANSVYQENAGVVAVVLELSNPSSTPIVVPFGFAGTASPVSDANISASPILFQPGEINKSIQIQWIDDVVDEDNENLILGLLTGQGVNLGTQTTHELTVIDNDLPPTIEFTFVSQQVLEGNADVSVTVRLSTISALPVTANFSYSGNAQIGQDYNSSSSNLTLEAGQISKSINVNLIDDNVFENPEQLILNIENPSNATLGQSTTHTITIQDNETTPVLTINNGPIDIQEGSATSFTISVDKPLSFPITIPIATAGTAISGADYPAIPANLTLAAGLTELQINLPTLQDGIDEIDETIVLSLTNPNGTILGNPATLTINLLDGDPTPTLNFLSTHGRVSEGQGVSTIQATLSSPSSREVRATIQFTGSATQGQDYNHSIPGQLVFSPGQTTVDLPITLIDDQLDENDESIVLTLTNPSHANLGPRAQSILTVEDNDISNIGFETGNSSVREEDGATPILLALSSPSAAAISIEIAAAGTANVPSDISLTPTTVHFAPGEVQKSISVSSVDDNIHEGSESLVLTLINPQNVILGGTTTHTITIEDNEAIPVIQWTLATQTVSESVGQISLTAQASGPSSQIMSASLSYTGNATLGEDFAISAPSLIIPPGDTELQISINILNDEFNETEETLQVTLLTPMGATIGSRSIHTITISDDDPLPSITFAQATQSVTEETAVVPIEITLSKASRQPIAVSFAVSGTASSADFSLTQTQANFAPGVVSQILNLNITDDQLDEINETIVLTLQQPANVDLGSISVTTVTVVDNDEAPVVQFSSTQVNVGEDIGTESHQITLSAPSSLPVTATLAISGSASSGDFSISSTDILIPAGSTEIDFNVTINEDTLDEFDELIVVELTNLSHAQPGTNNTLQITINDNDEAPEIQFAVASQSTAESTRIAKVQLLLSAASGKPVSASFDFTGTAALGADFSVPRNSITFIPGQTSTELDIVIVDDVTNEVDEQVVIQIAELSNATIGASSEHTLTILADDAIASLVPSHLSKLVLFGRVLV